MDAKILIASSDKKEIEQLNNSLSSKYSITKIHSIEEITGSWDEYSLVLLDQNFNQFQGLDFLMMIMSKHHLPVLMLSSEDNHETALEAINAGAHNFIVKAEGYLHIIAFAIRDSIKHFNENHSLQIQISALKNRIKELERPPSVEQSLVSNKDDKPGGISRSIMGEIVSKIKAGKINLPVYPKVIEQFKSLVSRAAYIDEISQLLEKDPSISSKMISVANSAYYRGMNPVKTLEQAISRIGIAETCNYVELIANRGLYAMQNKKYKVYLETLWMHSLACAYICQEISKKLQVNNPAELFAMGLFHDIGKLLLIQILAELELKGGYEKEIPKSEWLKLVQTHHGKFGASLMKNWKLAEDFSLAAQWHENPEKSENITQELLIVGAANLIAQTMGFGAEGDVSIQVEESFQARRLKLGLEQIDEIKGQVEELMQAGAVV